NRMLSTGERDPYATPDGSLVLLAPDRSHRCASISPGEWRKERRKIMLAVVAADVAPNFYPA
ncbi:hypothetical protein, partial [Pseudomonas sp. EL_65y_Pfl2_R96]|uniref:hypothetical protein n=1 Tax=Pseudomonas sp. EL_65y_Pfl2_R96 TaxID=3088699 RepID=UPI0030D7C4D2